MQNVTLAKEWSGNPAGSTVGVEDNIATNLIGQGIARDPNPAPEQPVAKPAAKKKAKKKKAKKK